VGRVSLAPPLQKNTDQIQKQSHLARRPAATAARRRKVRSRPRRMFPTNSVVVWRGREKSNRRNSSATHLHFPTRTCAAFFKPPERRTPPHERTTRHHHPRQSPPPSSPIPPGRQVYHPRPQTPCLRTAAPASPRLGRTLATSRPSPPPSSTPSTTPSKPTPTRDRPQPGPVERQRPRRSRRRRSRVVTVQILLHRPCRGPVRPVHRSGPRGRAACDRIRSPTPSSCRGRHNLTSLLRGAVPRQRRKRRAGRRTGRRRRSRAS
jgi:hypothetical protein